MADKPNFTSYTDLASERMGAEVLFATDDFFAEKENLIKSSAAVFIPEKYTEQGKWMDGWESRRKRTPGHDWCVLKLGRPAFLRGFDVDTSHFLGNHPPFASIEACFFEEGAYTAAGEAEIENEAYTESNAPDWVSVLPKSTLAPGSHNFFEAEETVQSQQFTHIRLHIYPDGGVARLRIFGEIKLEAAQLESDELINLAGAENGARCLECNDMFFSDMGNLLLPDSGRNMGDGWETKRNRTLENVDWVVLKLAHKGSLEKALVDTKHFKGNFPDCCSIEACLSDTETPSPDQEWKEVLPKTKLQADHEHHFDLKSMVATHLRLKIYPDGGISRLRIFGRVKI